MLRKKEIDNGRAVEKKINSYWLSFYKTENHYTVRADTLSDVSVIYLKYKCFTHAARAFRDASMALKVA